MESVQANMSDTSLSLCDENRLLMLVNEYFTPFLCLFGAVGNCLSIYVFFTTASHRSLTSSYYLSALAASDTGFLLTLFAFWLTTVQGLDIITTTISCPIVMYSAQVMAFLSVWFVVAFTVERFFAVCYPLTRPTVCTVTRARRVISGLSLLAVTMFAYVLVFAEVVQDNHSLNTTAQCPMSDDGDSVSLRPESNLSASMASSLQFENAVNEVTSNSSNETVITNCEEMTPYFVCTVPQEYHKFSQIANYVDTFLTFILPFCAICFLNFRITLCVWKLKGQRETIVALSKLNDSSNSRQQTSRSRLTVNLVNNMTMRGNPNDFRNCSQPRNGVRRPQQGMNSVSTKRGRRFVPSRGTPANAYSSSSRGEVRVTKTLLLVSTVFLVFNLPSHAIRVVIFIKHTLLGLQIGCDWLSAQEWANILYNTNFGVNFLLYCVSGRNFRKSLRNIFCSKSDAAGGCVIRRRRRLLAAKPFFRCPYSRTGNSRTQRSGNPGRNEYEFDDGRKIQEPLSGSSRNPSIHSTGAFVSKTHESVFPTSVTEVETYA